MAVLTRTQVVYPEQTLPTGRTVGLGLQHVIAMFGATVLAPILMGFDPNLAIFFSGIGTLIFMLIVRGRIPSYLGSSFAFIAAVVYLLVGLGAKTSVGTKVIAALMPPAVTAAVIAVIGIGLAPVGWDMAS